MIHSSFGISNGISGCMHHKYLGFQKLSELFAQKKRKPKISKATLQTGSDKFPAQEVAGMIPKRKYCLWFCQKLKLLLTFRTLDHTLPLPWPRKKMQMFKSLSVWRDILKFILTKILNKFILTRFQKKVRESDYQKTLLKA